MEIEKKKEGVAVTTYGITIKVIKQGYKPLDYIAELELRDIFEEVVKLHKGIMCDSVYEEDSIKRKHLHGTFVARKGIRRNLYKKAYTHVHIDPLDSVSDVERWTHYIHKLDTTS